MPETAGIPDFNSPVVEHARKDFPLLDADMTVAEALDRIRREGIGERVIYFFAVDADKRLVGVLPTRRLLTAPLDTPLQKSWCVASLPFPPAHRCSMPASFSC